MAKAAFNKTRTLFTSPLDLELRKKLVKCCVWSIALYGAEACMLRAVDQKHLESFEMWCWRRMEKFSWTDHVRNEDVLLRVKEQRNILHEIRQRKVNWIGHILRRNCLLQRVTEGKIQGGIEVTGRQGRRCTKLLDDLNLFSPSVWYAIQKVINMSLASNNSYLRAACCITGQTFLAMRVFFVSLLLLTTGWW